MNSTSANTKQKMDSESDWKQQLLSIYKIRFKLNQTEFMRAIMRCKNGTSSPEQPANQCQPNQQHDMNNCMVWLVVVNLMERWRSLIHFIPFHIITFGRSFVLFVRSFVCSFICLILIKREYTYVSIIIFIVLWNIIIANCNTAWWICACNLLGFFVVRH